MTEKLNVLIPAYKAAEYIEECVDSVFRNTWVKNGGDITVTVGVDGCQETLAAVQSMRYRYRNLKVISAAVNSGVYIMLNNLFSTVKEGWCLVFGADDIMNSDMLGRLMERPATGLVHYHGVLFIHIDTFRKLGGFRPWRCAGDTELLGRLSKIDRINRFPPMFHYRQHKDQLTRRSDTGRHSELRQGYIRIINSERPLYLEPELSRFVTVPARKVSFNIATYPPRERALKQVIEHLKGRVDTIRVCLNEYKKIPDWLRDTVGVTAVIPERDLKDNGKFLWCGRKADEYYFTADDDLLYSDAFIERHLEELERYAGMAVVSSHGRILKPGASTLHDHAEYIPCLKDRAAGTWVNICGTGVMAFDRSVYSFQVPEGAPAGMADAVFAAWASAAGVPLYVRAHRASELTYLLKGDDGTLWDTLGSKHEQYKKVLDGLRQPLSCLPGGGVAAPVYGRLKEAAVRCAVNDLGTWCRTFEAANGRVDRLVRVDGRGHGLPEISVSGGTLHAVLPGRRRKGAETTMLMTGLGYIRPSKTPGESRHGASDPGYMDRVVDTLTGFTMHSVRNQTLKDFTWVFCHGPLLEKRHMDRIEKAAEDMHVLFWDTENDRYCPVPDGTVTAVFRMDADDYMHPELMERVRAVMSREYAQGRIVVSGPSAGYKLYPGGGIARYDSPGLAIGLAVMSGCGAHPMHSHRELQNILKKENPGADVRTVWMEPSPMYLYNRSDISHSAVLEKGRPTGTVSDIAAAFRMPDEAVRWGR